jgi:hypothetical protein
MQPMMVGSRAAWLAEDLHTDPGWIITLDEAARRDLLAAVRRARDPDRALFDYRRDDFDLGAAWRPIAAALEEVKRGRGVALLRGLPRDDVSEAEFELLTWAIGLHVGVARPQGKASHYVSAVRDAGTAYRTATGRGYSSSAELDFHTDSADIAVLACYNQAPSGGMSMVSSSVTAHNVVATERPDLAELLHGPFHFSRQAEQAPDETPFYANPIFDIADGLLCSKWNRNRLEQAQRLDGVPRIDAEQRAALDALDDVLRRPELMHSMYLRPGDLQMVNNHTTLHARTDFVDDPDPARKRLLFRLWLAPPDSPRLPESWQPAYRSVTPGSVRGGIIGQQHDERCRDFERRQAAEFGMT